MALFAVYSDGSMMEVNTSKKKTVNNKGKTVNNERMIINILGEAVVTGQFVGLDFIKKDGSLRTMTAKVDARALDRLDRDLITVFDVKKGGYRSFDINSLLYISHRGKLTAAF